MPTLEAEPTPKEVGNETWRMPTDEKLPEKKQGPELEKQLQQLDSFKNNMDKTLSLRRKTEIVWNALTLRKSDYNDLYLHLLKENPDKDTEEIKKMTEIEYNRKYVETSKEEAKQLSDAEKIEHQLEILETDKEKLAKMNYRGLQSLKKDLNKWHQYLSETLESGTLSEEDKKSSEEILEKIDKYMNRLSRLDQEYLQLKREQKEKVLQKIKGFVKNIFSFLQKSEQQTKGRLPTEEIESFNNQTNPVLTRIEDELNQVPATITGGGLPSTRETTLPTSKQLRERAIETAKGIIKEKLAREIKQTSENTPLEIDKRSTYFTGDSFKYLWQSELYGKKPEKHSDSLYRGYFMVEKEDFPAMVKILRELALDRKNQGRGLYFKWLLAKDVDEKSLQSGECFGKYETLENSDPRVVIYGDSAEEIQEIIQTITTDSRWKELIKKMSEKRSYPTAKARRPGANAYKDENGYEWRAICYNNKPGYSEHEAADPDWREGKIGIQTGQMRGRPTGEGEPSGFKSREEARKSGIKGGFIWSEKHHGYIPVNSQEGQKEIAKRK